MEALSEIHVEDTEREVTILKIQSVNLKRREDIETEALSFGKTL